MSQDKNAFSSNNEENEEIKSLLQILKEKDEKLIEAFEEQESFALIRKIELEYNQIAKRINSLYAQLNLDQTVKESYTDSEVDTARAKYFHEYRSHIDKTNLEKSELVDNLTQVTPIAPPGKSVTFNFNHPAFQLHRSKSQGVKYPAAHSTPKVENFDKLSQLEKETVIKTELAREFDHEVLTTFYDNKDNLDFVDQTFKEEPDIDNLFTRIRDRILAFAAPLLKKDLTLVSNTSEYASAINNFSEQSGLNNSEEMPDSFDIRGLSVKDALDLIPRFNGANIPLSQFLDGCNEASNIIPAALKAEFVKLIRIRLYGEALNIVRLQSFDSLETLSEFFEKMFGSSRTYYDLTGELAKIRQQSGESVVIYLNRLKDIEKEIRKAAQKEKRITEENVFDSNLKKDCLKYFMRGLRWEIKARMGSPETYEQAQEEAIETEREFACTIFDEPTVRKVEEKEKNSKDIRKINIIEASKPICGYCKKEGHVVANCFAFARLLARSSPAESPNPRFNFNRNQQRPNNNFGGWNAGNRQRMGFFPQQSNFNSNQNFTANRNNFNPSRNFNDNMNGQRSRTFYNGNRFQQNNVRNNNFNPNTNMRMNGPTRRDDSNGLTCYYCKKKNHIQRNCYQYQRDMNQSNSSQGNAPVLSQMGVKRETTENTRPPLQTLNEKNVMPQATTSRV